MNDQQGRTVDGVWCHPDGGARLTTPTVSPEIAIRFESEYNTVWVRHTHDDRGRSTWENVMEDDGFDTEFVGELDRETVERMIDKHSPEQTATMPISMSPWGDD